MESREKSAPQAPRIVEGGRKQLAGLNERFRFDDTSVFPKLWLRFRSHLGQLPDQVDDVVYGVCHNMTEVGGDYLACVEVKDISAVPPAFVRLRLEPRRYAVFTHVGPVSEVSHTYMSIFDEWLPGAGYQFAHAPLFERFDTRFDPETGLGGFEIWVPIES